MQRCGLTVTLTLRQAARASRTSRPSHRTLTTGSAIARKEDGRGEQADADAEADSVQARLIRALEEKYVAPTAAAQLPPRRPAVVQSEPRPPHQQLSTSQAESAVAQVVAESLVEAEQVGATQAAIIAESSSAARATVPSTSRTTSGEEIQPPEMGTFEEGRFLPRTPDGQPWNAKYVRPAHAGSKGDGSAVPSIHYGKLLGKGGGGGGSTSSMKSTSQRLKDLGVNPSSLPLDDAKAMRAVREGIRRFERAGRVYSAKYGASQYRVGKLSNEEIAQLEAEIEREMELARARKLESQEDEGSSNVTLLGRQMPESRDSSRSRGGAGSMSLRRWTSVADERIEAARAAGFFKENKLRGKPLEWEVHERNPYLGKEEFLMNRIVKRQGAAPPWVELNQQFHSDLHSLRAKMIDSYSRRAVRHYTQSGMLTSSSGPGTGSSGGLDDQRRAYFLSLARSYRDGEWINMEKGYHTEAVKDLNETLRKHNSISPPSARRGMVTREGELDKCFEDSVEFIADGLEEAWLELTGRKVRPGGVWGSDGSASAQSFDIWGQPVRESGAAPAWTTGLSSLFSRSSRVDLDKKGGEGGGEGGDGVVHRAGHDERTERRDGDDDGRPYLGQGLLDRIKTWLSARPEGDKRVS